MKRTLIRSRRAEPRRSSRVHDVAFMAWVRTQPCCTMDLDESLCTPPSTVQAHHAGSRGLGQKADDTTCIPLCAGCHHDFHSGTGPFRGWTREQRRAWADAKIAETQRAWQRSQQLPDNYQSVPF